MPPDIRYPGDYTPQVGSERVIWPDATSVAAFVAPFDRGPLLAPAALRDWSDFERIFGGLAKDNAASYAVMQFYENGGKKAVVVRIEAAKDGNALRSYEAGLLALESQDFNLLCLPVGAGGDVSPAIHALAVGFCEKKRAFYIADAPHAWLVADDPVAMALREEDALLPASPNAGLYFPWFSAPDPLADGRSRDFAPCGAIAGVFARTDSDRGVWATPAGAAAGLTRSTGPSIVLSDHKQGLLNPLAVNCLRRSQRRTYVWGARTRAGRDGLASEWKYVSVRRLFLFIERSVARGLDWAVFEPNDERLWAAVRLSVQRFLEDLFRQGAFQGSAQDDAFFVRCDRSTMTQADLDDGRLIVTIGAAPLRPAEFVVVSVRKLVRPSDDP